MDPVWDSFSTVRRAFIPRLAKCTKGQCSNEDVVWNAWNEICVQYFPKTARTPNGPRVEICGWNGYGPKRQNETKWFTEPTLWATYSPSTRPGRLQKMSLQERVFPNIRRGIR
ncbi:hypothetical protein V8E54_003659 [Elaphomyces granulatus]